MILSLNLALSKGERKEVPVTAVLALVVYFAPIVSLYTDYSIKPRCSNTIFFYC